MTSNFKIILNTCLIFLLVNVFNCSTTNAQAQQIISLDRAIQMGMDYSHQLEASRGRYDYSKAKHDQAYDLGYPVSGISASYYRLSEVPEWTLPGTEEPVFPVYQNSYQNRISLNQLVFAGFRVRSAK